MNRTSVRHLLGTGLAAMALSVSAVAVAAPAGAADTGSTNGQGRHGRVHLTDEQKQCMKDQGITRPIRPLTQEKIDAIKAAAKTCDIKLPKRLGHRLTDTQKQCMQDQGITRPIRPLTPEKVTALKAAAKACDVTLPHRKHHGNRPQLTDEQKQCMQDQGITRPIRPLTQEKIAAIKAAAQACGIQLPNRAANPQS